MGRSGNARKRKRALLALTVNPGQGINNQRQDTNKFAPPDYSNRKLPTAEVDTENLMHDGGVQNGPTRRKGKGKEKKRAERKARMSMGKMILDPSVTEVTVRWADGVERTVKLSGGASGVDGAFCGAVVEESKKIDDETRELPVERESRERSASREISSNDHHATHARESLDHPTDTIGPSSADFIQETQPSQFLPQPELQKKPSPAPVEIADSQASEDDESFHDSQEYPNFAANRETFEYAVQATQTTPRSQHMFSAQKSPVLGRSPGREAREYGDDRMEACNTSSPPIPGEQTHRDGHIKEYNSSSPPVPGKLILRDERMEERNSPSPPVRKEPSPELPKLRRVVKPRVTRKTPGSSQSVPTPRAKPANKWMISADSSTPKPIDQIKRQYDPYDLIPSPPPKRILRSTGKPFARPPWKLGELEPISSSATDTALKTPGKVKPSLVSPFPVISEEELVSIFSSPDPHFDKFDQDSSALEADAPELPPPRHTARRTEDRGELSDDTSFSAVMSTPLKNYGKTPTAIRSLPRPKLVSIHKRTPTSRTQESTAKSRRLANKLAAVLGSLPTSSTGEADSLSDTSRSGTSTNATTPTAEAAPVLADEKPVTVVNETMPVVNKTRIEVQIPTMSSLRQSQQDAVSYSTPSAARGLSSPAAESTPRQETTRGSVLASTSRPRKEATRGSTRTGPTPISTPAGRVSVTTKDTPPLNSATKMCTPIPVPRPWLNATRSGSSATKTMMSSAGKPASVPPRRIVQDATPPSKDLSPALENELGSSEEASASRTKKLPVSRKKRTPVPLEKEAPAPPKKQTPVPLPPHIARMMMS
ncbi:uncharacterized protein DNG_05967 [Cephalotrichum gorgonifer]|uniref:Uncharacterized protein n=1 Tax=Cephalotrichum gorgonifer TaxID=2041049 RepID=A0AAE8SW14_9PEZI|nr:uncharacterized protein DNG_05967 [Cephalotrichum gorgonifer]